MSSLFASLMLVGLGGCQALGPTSGAASGEVVADTKLALPGDTAWTAFGADSRKDFAAVQLTDGSVLACGGATPNSTGGPTFQLTCNRLSFGTVSGSQTFPLPEARVSGTLSLVPPNRVLLAGGRDATGKALTARLSSPLSWSDNQVIWGAPEGDSSSPSPRTGHTATRLDSNIALIGGEAGVKQVSAIDVRSDQGVWTKVDVANGLAQRIEHTATLLKSQSSGDARVLVLGGYGQGNYLNSGFIFSLPNTITPVASMPEARKQHTATLLDDGSVLVVGGMGVANNGALLDTAWRYYPDRDSWVSAGTIVPRKYHASTRLGADVIVAGGTSTPDENGGLDWLGGSQDAPANPKTVQRYYATTNTWSAAPNLLQGRMGFQLFALEPTYLLALGGANGKGVLGSSELFAAGSLGQVAGDSTACVSGHAADGVCCDVACEGPCHWCDDPAAPGICQAVTGTPGNQNGCPNRLECSKGTCAPQCDATHRCETGYFCSSGSCLPELALGAACGAARECANGAPCVDGVCCESTCKGSCEACNQPDLRGLCRPLAAGTTPREGHPSCASARDSECAATCDGHTTDRCFFPQANVSCGESATCTAGGFQRAGQCNGKGVCASTFDKCNGYACDPTGGCFEECQSDSQCADGKHCYDGQHCSSCDETACNAGGYRCTEAGVCPNSCAKSESDCAGGYYCHPLERRCVQAVPFPAAALPACNIRPGTSRSPAALLALVGLVCAGATRRRLRARRRTE